jgi:hypothetical protein
VTGPATALSNHTDKKGSQRELTPKNPTTITTKEVKIMSTTIAPSAQANPYATAANPELQRHHWQNLAGMVASFRPDWAIDRILDNLWGSRNKQTFPELAHIALTVAMNPKYKTPGAIGLAAAAVIEL